MVKPENNLLELLAVLNREIRSAKYVSDTDKAFAFSILKDVYALLALRLEEKADKSTKDYCPTCGQKI